MDRQRSTSARMSRASSRRGAAASAGSASILRSSSRLATAIVARGDPSSWAAPAASVVTEARRSWRATRWRIAAIAASRAIERARESDHEVGGEDRGHREGHPHALEVQAQLGGGGFQVPRRLVADEGPGGGAGIGGGGRAVPLRRSDPQGAQVDGRRFRVIGVVERKGKFLFFDRDNLILVPWAPSQKRTRASTSWWRT